MAAGSWLAWAPPPVWGQEHGDRETPQKQDLATLSIDELGAVKVTSAALHEQTAADAPASVTVITAEDIRTWGCRTLADALAKVHGFFATTDYTYDAVGIRGFSLPGYEGRYMVMIDGHNIADNITDAPYVGADLPLDLDLVERIEVIDGPSSALYGSSAMLATINVITKRPGDVKSTSVRVATGSLREREIAASTAVRIGKRGALLAGASVFNNGGAEQLYFPEFDSPENNFGRAIDMNGEKGYRAFLDLTWGNWEALAVAGDRVIVQPFSWGDTAFNDRGTRVEDSRGFIDLSYHKALPGDRNLSWRTSYDAYRYRGIYHYSSEDGVVDSRERDYGDWLTSKFAYVMPDSKNGRLTLGADLRMDLRALQNAYDVGPAPVEWLRIDRRDRYAGVFAQQEWALDSHWALNLGARFDWSWLKHNAVSPRIAVIYKLTAKTNLKLLYGRGFRNPNSYDMFWSDGFTQIGNPRLEPETTGSYEFDLEHAFHKRLRFRASAYHYDVNHLVEQIYTPDGLMQYVNGEHVRATGASVEIDCLLPAGVRLSSSLAIQRAVFRSQQVLPNAPGQVGKLNLSIPFVRGRFSLFTGVQAMGRRQTYAGATLPWFLLPEATLSAARLPGGLEFSAGVRNLSNTLYRDPAGLTPKVDSVIAPGRTYFLNLTWRSSAEAGPSR